MNGNKRPLPVTVLAWVYIAVGAIGFVSHFTELLARNPFHYDAVLVELTESLAIICGAFMLQGHNWARWLALAWIAFHVVLSAFHALPELAMHALVLRGDCLVSVSTRGWALFSRCSNGSLILSAE
ncbi:MAG TPA: hypothetical protein VH325_17570 [Bryobacteraceae bacterium]|jgi:hypothetical protein|nr:hypothetical protein [Bryobacteraceae bacterium]